MPKISEAEDNFLLKPALLRSEQIAERICMRIQTEKLVPGTFLGTVDNLTEQFGVSRTVVREAVGSLRGLGVITGRPKVGLSVAKGDIQSVLRKVLIPQTTHEKGWRELAKFRVVIEIGSLPLAIENTTDIQIEKLNQLISEQKAILKQQENSPAEVFHQFIQKDLAFHETLLQSANQDLITQFHQVLVKYFDQGKNFFPNPTIQMVQEHQEIVDAIADRNSESAVQKMTRHLNPILTRIHTMNE